MGRNGGAVATCYRDGNNTGIKSAMAVRNHIAEAVVSRDRNGGFVIWEAKAGRRNVSKLTPITDRNGDRVYQGSDAYNREQLLRTIEQGGREQRVLARQLQDAYRSGRVQSVVSFGSPTPRAFNVVNDPSVRGRGYRLEEWD